MRLTRLFVFIQLSISIASACLHYPKSYKSQLTEGMQEFFLFHDGKSAHMILRTELSANKFPKEIAWVLPFPSLPSKYEEVDGPLFQELSALFESRATDRGFGSKGMPATEGIGSNSIKVHEKVVVGNYQIQPIEILSDKGGQELNNWLTKNKFNPMPQDKQTRYLHKGAAFLAIRMEMNRPDAETFLSKPLHVTYPSDTLAVPMLFTHEGRKFDMDIYVYSQKEMKLELGKLYFDRRETVPYKRKRLKPIMENLIGDNPGWITRYSARELNSKEKPLKALKQDPSFALTLLQ